MSVGNHRFPPYTAEIQTRIRQHPYEAVALGFLTGFVLGGGQKTRIGQGLVGFAARMALRAAVSRALTEAVRTHE
jgi:hypothetical protein